MTPELNLIESLIRLRNGLPLIEIEDLSLWIDERRALDCVSFDIFPGEILALIGPSGCGASTALKCLNRMHDGIRGLHIEGQIRMDNVDIHNRDVDPPLHRRRFGWIARWPAPFPISIHENVAYGARLHGLVRTKGELDDHVEGCLRRVRLWDEVKDHLHRVAGPLLPPAQQQLLCMARALATEPDVLLMDEPTCAVDSSSGERVEEVIVDLKDDHSVVVVTGSMKMAKRVADRVAYFHTGRLLELRGTAGFFARPSTPEARDFVEGRLN